MLHFAQLGSDPRCDGAEALPEAAAAVPPRAPPAVARGDLRRARESSLRPYVPHAPEGHVGACSYHSGAGRASLVGAPFVYTPSAGPFA